MSNRDTQSDETDSSDWPTIDRRTALQGGAAGLGLLGLSALSTGSAVGSNGADKIFAAGSTHEIVADSNKSNSNEWSTGPVTLAEGSIKTSSPTDLIVYAQMETALYTDVKLSSGGPDKDKDETSAAFAGVTCWVEIDGTHVPITTDANDDGTHDDPSYGDVVFNNRHVKVESSFLEDIENITDTEEYFEMWQRTRSTNGFNWVALNLGSSDYYSASKNHSIALKADLEVFVDDKKARAKAVAGPRTLVAIPAKLANDATV